jgi:Ras-related GTP-binding protein C/D
MTRTVALNIYTQFAPQRTFLISFAAKIMPLLETGRRRTKLDHSYSGPPRQGPVRHISPAQLSLERIYEQNRLNVQKRDGAKAPEPAPGPAAKGKPRLLLMGQRR